MHLLAEPPAFACIPMPYSQGIRAPYALCVNESICSRLERFFGCPIRILCVCILCVRILCVNESICSISAVYVAAKPEDCSKRKVHILIGLVTDSSVYTGQSLLEYSNCSYSRRLRVNKP